MQEVGVGVPTDVCRRWDSGDHPIVSELISRESRPTA